MSRNKKLKANKNKKQLSQKEIKPVGSAKDRRLIQRNSFLKGNWKVNALIFLLLIIATLIFYSRDLDLGFFGVDDPGYVTNDPWIKSFSGKNISFIFTHPYFANFSPVHLLSYMLDYAIAGPDPHVFHLSSNIWSAFVTGFVFLVALALMRDQLIAISAAVLFLFHPVHVEAVAWISSRKDLIAAAFILPCLLAYLRYRKGGSSAKWWYIFSLILFLFAIAGKLSVAIFPAVLFAVDVLVEKRNLGSAIIDKIPFLLIGIIFGLAVMSAQPSSGNHADPFVYLASLGQSLLLLTGFGSYVIYRVPPGAASIGIEVLSTIILGLVLLLPLFLRRKLPMAAVLIYWIVFTFLPSQVLSFIHPVTDRYLFLPSVGFVILIAWTIITIGKRFKRKGLIASLLVVLMIAVLWGKRANDYLNEWNDPRSVWYAATQKSSDPEVYYGLAGNYLDIASRLGAKPKKEFLPYDKASRIANIVWANDPRLPNLLSNWKKNEHGDSTEKEFQNQLWGLSWSNFEQALHSKGTRTLPYLFFSRGVLLLDEGKLEGARKEFMASLKEVSISTSKDVQGEILVSCHHALGAIAFQRGDNQEALQWLELAEKEQDQFEGNWIPELPENIKLVKDIISRSGKQ